MILCWNCKFWSICNHKFCIKIYVLRNTSDFAKITQKIAQKRAKLNTFHAQKKRKSSQKKYLRENYPNVAQKIWSFRGNPNTGLFGPPYYKKNMPFWSTSYRKKLVFSVHPISENMSLLSSRPGVFNIRCLNWQTAMYSWKYSA